METMERLHPFTILIYYGMAVVLMAVAGQPLLYGLVWILALLHYILTAGGKRGLRMLGYSLGASVLCLLVNPLLNHRGVTLLFMLGGQRVTREAVLYGVHMAVLLSASLLLFSCFSIHMTSKNIMTLLAGRLPSFSLLFSMILRFVPRAGRDFREMTALHGSRPAVWTALIGMSLEDSVERSLSMKSRHYGKGRRSSFYQKPPGFYDVLVSGISIAVTAGMLIYQYLYPVRVRFFPSISIEELPLWMWLVLIVFYGLPLIWRGKEEASWLISRRKITGFPIREQTSRRLRSEDWP